ncbi:hypothetical protein AcV7_001685 [Taiwanofungus camphoratus]|nr:hypothetical protein AcV7_001685 [Antrodia cinnamomea]
MRRILLKRQTLTAIHDLAGAWNGLGSALLSLWRQAFLAASVVGTLQVVVYLASLSVIHIATPALFSTELFNHTDSIVVSTIIGMPSISDVADRDSVLISDVWESTSELLPYLALVTPQQTLGLYNDILYGFPVQPNFGIGSTLVGATAANVTCGYLSGMSAVVNEGPYTVGWTLQATQDDYDIMVDIDIALAPDAMRQVNSNAMSSKQPLSRDMIFVLSSNISDSEGQFDGIVPLPEPSCIMTSNVSACIYSLQVLGCTLSWVNRTVTVDSRTGLLVEPESIEEKTSSTWEKWTPQSLSSEFDPQVDSWAKIFTFAGNSSFANGITWTNNIAGQEVENYATAQLTEQYIMDSLGMTPFNATPTSNVTLPQFENALANMTAALYWAAQHYTGKCSDISFSFRESVQMTYLALNQLAVGLSASLVLLILAITLTRATTENTPLVDTLGVMQTIWLASKQPMLQELVGHVDEPTIENLRAAGMFEVNFAKEETVMVKGERTSYFKLDFVGDD